MASVSISTRTFTGFRILRRNCICSCGTQVRAPVEVLRRGIECPNCSRTVHFEEQFDPAAAQAFGEASGLLGKHLPLDFNTKPFSLAERIGAVSKWVLIASVVIPLCIALGLLVPNTLDSLGLVNSQPAKPQQPAKDSTSSNSMVWSRVARWNLASESLSGSLGAARIVKEFSTRASASEYERLERLFDYEKMSSAVYEGRVANQSGIKQSFDGIQKDLKELIIGFLEETQRITPGSHDFRMIGYTTQGSYTGILMRYYRESATPASLLDSEELLLPLTKMIPFDKFQLYCDNIFKTKFDEPRSNPRLQGYMYTNFFADRHFGYVVLTVNGNGSDAQIEDIFDLQLKKPLSQYCLVWSDASEKDIGQIEPLGQDIPGPSDTDLRIVQHWIKNRKDRTRQFDLDKIRTTLANLYTQTKDPLMQDLLGRLEFDAGNLELASDFFRKAKADNFKSLDAFRYLISEALQSGDQELLVERLHDLNHLWDIKITGLEAEEDRKMFHKFQGYWRRGESL